MRTIPPSSMRSKQWDARISKEKRAHSQRKYPFNHRIWILFSVRTLLSDSIIPPHKWASSRRISMAEYQCGHSQIHTQIRAQHCSHADHAYSRSVVPLCVVAVDIGEKRRVGESLRFETRHCQMCGVSDPGGAEMREASLSFLGKALCDRGGRHTE